MAGRSRGAFSAAVERRLTFAIAAGASVLSAAASFPDARHFLFWDDELASVKVISEPAFSGLLGHIARSESTPPAWYVLAWIFHHAGVSMTGLRLFSVLFAAALAGLTVLYARRFVSLPGLALVGLLAAVGGEFMRHNWELRAYAMFVLLCMLFALTLEWTARSPSKRRLAVFGTVVALGSLSHYFFLFTLVTGLVWLWLTPAFKSVRRRVTVAAVLGLIPLIAWSPEFVHQTEADHTRRFAGFAWSKIGRAYTRLLAPGLPKHGWLFALYVVIDILVVVGVIVLFRRGGLARLCALLALAPLVCAGFLSLVGFDILDFRNLIGGGPFAAVAVVVALDAIPVRPLARAAIAAVFVLAVCGFAFKRPGPPRRHEPKPHRSAIRVALPQPARVGSARDHGTGVRAPDAATARASRAFGS